MGHYSREEFNRWIPGLFKREGGFNPNVGGTGEYVNRGITQSSYPNEDIKGMSEQRAADIYFNDYWSKLPAGLSPEAQGIYFDAAVHSGGGGAKRSFGGNYDPKAMIANRRAYLNNLSDKQKFSQFKRGWGKRMDNLEQDIYGSVAAGPAPGSGGMAPAASEIVADNTIATAQADPVIQAQNIKDAYARGVEAKRASSGYADFSGITNMISSMNAQSQALVGQQFDFNKFNRIGQRTS